MEWFVMSGMGFFDLGGLMRFKLSWLMEWFVINFHNDYARPREKFQTKLTYGMICYPDELNSETELLAFQTKLTYGMICYLSFLLFYVFYLFSFKLSWLMVWFVIWL